MDLQPSVGNDDEAKGAIYVLYYKVVLVLFFGRERESQLRCRCRKREGERASCMNYDKRGNGIIHLLVEVMRGIQVVCPLVLSSR
jgi:hypothetical protein